MEKLITVYWDGDYGACYFEEHFESKTLSELIEISKSMSATEKQRNFELTYYDEDCECDAIIYIQVYDDVVVDDNMKLALCKLSDGVIDYDHAKHHSYFIINN